VTAELSSIIARLHAPEERRQPLSPIPQRTPVAALHIGEKRPLCVCLPKPPNTPRRYQVSLAKNGNGPVVAAFSRRPSIPGSQSRTTPGSTISSALGLSFRYYSAT
jgi:hypothetical protein